MTHRGIRMCTRSPIVPITPVVRSGTAALRSMLHTDLIPDGKRRILLVNERTGRLHGSHRGSFASSEWDSLLEPSGISRTGRVSNDLLSLFGHTFRPRLFVVVRAAPFMND